VLPYLCFHLNYVYTKDLRKEALEHDFGGVVDNFISINILRCSYSFHIEMVL